MHNCSLYTSCKVNTCCTPTLLTYACMYAYIYSCTISFTHQFSHVYLHIHVHKVHLLDIPKCLLTHMHIQGINLSCLKLTLTALRALTAVLQRVSKISRDVSSYTHIHTNACEHRQRFQVVLLAFYNKLTYVHMYEIRRNS